MGATAMIYARVSTKEQGNNHSLPTQLELCRQHCERRGYRALNEFTDTYSGTMSDRPGINALIDAVALHKPDAVVILDVDRLGRTPRVQLVLEDELTAFGARIEFVNGGVISADGDEDETMVDIKKLFAKQENRIRVERSRRGKRGRAESGHPLVAGGIAPYGYSYVSELRKGRFEINEEEAAIVREMYRWLVIERVSCYEIAKRLYLRGVPTRGDVATTVAKKAGFAEWSPTSVHHLLTNTIYKGEWYWGKYRHIKSDGKQRRIPIPQEQWVKVPVPAIVDAALWEQVQPRLAENKRNAARNTRREYLLRGMIFCTCGRRWAGNYKSDVNRAYYRCANIEGGRRRSECDVRYSYRQDQLEAAIWEKVAKYLLEPETMLVDIQRQREAHAADSAKRTRQLGAIRKELADIEKKLATLLDKELEGYPKHIIEQHKQSLLDKHRDFTADCQRLEAEQREGEITPDAEAMLLQVSEMMRTALPAMTFVDKRRILELLRVRVDVIDRQHVRLSGIVTGSIVSLAS